MTGELGVAVVGLGAAARRIHLPAIAKTPGLRVIGGVDPIAEPSDFTFPALPCRGSSFLVFLRGILRVLICR